MDNQHEEAAAVNATPIAEDAAPQERSSDNQRKEPEGSFLKYQVLLTKTVYGLGIYFAETSQGHAQVDTNVPFYRLPHGKKGAGEASGIILPGDLLVGIDEKPLGAMEFGQIVEELRQIPCGYVRLTFERASAPVQKDHQSLQPQQEEQLQNQQGEEPEEKERPKQAQTEEPEVKPAHCSSWQHHLGWAKEMEAIVAELEQRLVQSQEATSRERKCRLLAEKKNILYRQEVVRLSDENLTLRFQLRRLEEKVKSHEKLLEATQLSI